MKQNDDIYLHDFFRFSLQHYWFISIIPKKHLRPIRRFDISIGNVHEVSNKFIRIKYYKYYLIPTFMKLNFSEIDEIRRYFIRKKSISVSEVESLNLPNSKTRNKQAKIAAFTKWCLTAFFVILLITLVTIFTVLFK